MTTTTDKTPKATSYSYGHSSQDGMLAKYRNRANNHWKDRIGLGVRLFEEHVKPRLKDKERPLIVDVGCSIGTFALEFNRLGYRTIGVDFDPVAVQLASQLNAEEGLNAEFLCADVSEWKAMSKDPIDCAVCFDIFEHLHDDELGALLRSLHGALSDKGVVLFSTTPTEYGNLYQHRTPVFAVVRTITRLLSYLPPQAFERSARALSRVVDALLLLRHGKHRRELIKQDKHCNPLTLPRLRDIFRRAGYDFVFLDSLNLHEAVLPLDRRLEKHPLFHTHVVGVAYPVRQGE